MCDQTTDAGAHGAFDDQAHGEDPLLWLSLRRRAVLTGAVGVISAAAGAFAFLRR